MQLMKVVMLVIAFVRCKVCKKVCYTIYYRKLAKITPPLNILLRPYLTKVFLITLTYCTSVLTRTQAQFQEVLQIN